MGRKSKEIDIDELKKKYEEVGSIKELAKMFHTSNNRIIDIFNRYNIQKKGVGNKIIFSKKIVKSIIKDYVSNNLTMDDICKKYNVKIDKLRSLLKENNINPSRWHGHIKNDSSSKICFLKAITAYLDERNLDYSLNYKVENKISVTLRFKDFLIDLYKNKNLIDYNGYDYRTVLIDKKNRCITNGFKLIQVFEDEYKENSRIVFSKIKHIFGIDEPIEKIQGRKCIVEKIEKGEAEMFLNDNHIQGFVGSTIHLGAKYNGKLIAVMSFLNEGDNKWNLTRFASLNDYVCQGVGGKLFKTFIRDYDPIEIRSFADRRWTLYKENNIYTKLGFKYEYSTPPAYHYAIDNGYERFRREKFKKQRLSKKYGLSEKMSEMQMAKKIGYGRIWDCGLFKYVWKKE